MKKLTIIYFQCITSILLSGALLTANAQNLPNVQKVSLRAPENIKIDGKPTEWNNFQAYNYNTNVFYTIANDDDNLYLVLKATDPDIINKIVGGGAMLTISKTGNKDKISISYPVVDTKSSQLIFNLQNKKYVMPDTSAMAVNAVMNSNNAILQKTFKSVVVNGIAGLDTLSVYNEKGIKAAGLFDTKKAYTYELAIPLKYLGLSVGQTSKFSYSIILNGCKPREIVKTAIPANESAAYRAGAEAAEAKISLELAQKYSKTDFSGEYTLAKKQ
jgi:hypothetical protein